MLQDLPKKIRKLFQTPITLAQVMFVVWLLGVLASAWGTIPLLNPPERLSVIVKLLFYRDYIF